MFEIKSFAGAKEYSDAAESFLLKHEAENNLQLSLLDRLKTNHHHYSYQDPILLTLNKDGIVCNAVLMTPPFNMVITRLSAVEMELLSDYLQHEEITIPGVLGPSEYANKFADIYCKKTGKSNHIKMHERIYQLDKVKMPSMPSGQMVLADQKDCDLYYQWGVEFAIEAEIGGPNLENRTIKATDASILEKRLFAWNDGGLKCQANFKTATKNSVGIGYVYTPPQHRKNGYASALVASLSQKMLDEGNQRCFLFTDLSNPTSNSIYTKIGYEEVCDFDMIEIS